MNAMFQGSASQSSTVSSSGNRLAAGQRPILHPDQGRPVESTHDRMQPYRAMLATHEVKQSMRHKANCFADAEIESFFGTLKAEYFSLDAPNSIGALDAGVHDDVHYDHERIKLGLQGLSPVEYRVRSTA